MEENKENEVILIPQEENNDKVVVYENGVTSIDFMLPEDEAEILKDNLNVYSNVDEMQKTLKEAQRNMKLRQKVKDLQMAEKYAELIDLTQNKQNEMLQIILQTEAFERLSVKNPEAAFKALKSIGDFNKTNVEAREQLIKKLNGNVSNKKFKIDLKFSNDSGEEYSFGVEA